MFKSKENIMANKKQKRKNTVNPYDKQIGGSHYLKYKIQPSKFVIENELLFPEGSVIKYICRHRFKNGKEDLEKAVHFIEMIIERDYNLPDYMEPMTEEEEYKNAGITKEEAEKKTQETWIEGYRKWKKGCPHN
jgi:hypothetical protein